LEQTNVGLRVKSTRSGKPRIIGLDDLALEVLATHREEQNQTKSISDLHIEITT